MTILTILLLLAIVVNFVLLAKGKLKTEVGMAITAMVAVLLAGATDGLHALESGFAEFSKIAIFFTAIAAPSHMLQRSDALDKVGMWIGEKIGMAKKNYNIDQTWIAVTVSLMMTYIMAGLFHNTTAILVSAAIVTVIAKSYKIPSIPLLSATLVASNLGGFSTRWGDTPNIIEAYVWNLTHADFFTQILPINLGVMALLITTTVLVIKRTKKNIVNKNNLVHSMIKFRTRRRNIEIDKKLFTVSMIGIMIAVIAPLLFPAYEIMFAILAIIICIIGDDPEHRHKTVFALGGETYATLISIFVLSNVVAHSHIGIGEYLKNILIDTNSSVWMVAIASYIGTLLTEAASWATAAAPIIHSVDATNKAAWALGAGICAGSSSLVTAASAGVILMHETEDNDPEDRITFGRYLKFGLPFSLLMLVFYIVILTYIY